MPSAREVSIPKEDITELLRDWSDGDQDALERLMPMLLEPLRKQAGAYMNRERGEHTLQPMALVNELYLRLIDQDRARWNDRAHFFAVAARLMKRILVDHARTTRADKRGGWAQQVELHEELPALARGGMDLVALDDALTTLAGLDARQARVVELRYFAGLTIAETAEVLGVTDATVSRDWKTAKAWLYQQLRRR